MELQIAGLTLITSVLMVGALIVSLIPIVPGPALLWAISVLYAALTNFEMLTLPWLIVITLLMILASTSDFWAPFLGIRTRGASCSSIFGTIVGGLLGTFLIPIPILG
ncbi:MAG: DUF456 domain-containing protein, partial [Chloroflexi bacterium]|nr:DUF456 domain-containing protein [Chloroflexota bacterium]